VGNITAAEYGCLVRRAALARGSGAELPIQYGPPDFMQTEATAIARSAFRSLDRWPDLPQATRLEPQHAIWLRSDHGYDPGPGLWDLGTKMIDEGIDANGPVA
jgi:hypothetical protein